MQNDNPDREGDLTALEQRLASWQPAAGTLDRDRMLYDAGRAAGDARARYWRLATAALLLVSLGLGGLTMQQRSWLGRERARLTHEQGRRLELETALAALSDASRASPLAAAPVVDVPPIGPPAPGSYLALTARLADGIGDGDWPGAAAIEREPAARPSGPAPAAAKWRPAPLRAQDIEHILDL
jgi:hypothetical protein